MTPEDEGAQSAQDAALAAATAEEQPQTEQPGAEPAAAAEAIDEDGEAAEAAAPPAKKTPAQERFDELTRLRREAERDRDYYKELALRGGAKPTAEQRQTPAVDEDPEPDPSDTDKYTYGDTDPAYLRDLGAHAARQEFKKLSGQQARETHAQAVARSFNERAAAFAKDKPDYRTLVDNDDLVISEPMTDAIMTSEVGPAVAYHLAQNPDEARRIAGLHPLVQFREIGKIEARLAPASEATTTPIKRASDAPEPPQQIVRGTGGKFKVPPDTDDFAAFERTYEIPAKR